MMSTAQMETAAVFSARVSSSGECAHRTFPDVIESEWLPIVLGESLSILTEAVTREGGMTLEEFAEVAEHALIVCAGAGMAAGRAEASQRLASLSSDLGG